MRACSPQQTTFLQTTILTNIGGFCIETKFMLLALLPLLSLVLLLSWAFLVITRRSNVKISLAGFGVKIALDSSDIERKELMHEMVKK